MKWTALACRGLMAEWTMTGRRGGKAEVGRRTGGRQSGREGLEPSWNEWLTWLVTLVANSWAEPRGGDS